MKLPMLVRAGKIEKRSLATAEIVRDADVEL